MSNCFVIMPFMEESQEFYFSIVKPAIESASFRAIRHDEIAGSGLVTSHLWQALQTADAVVADVSGRNPNVYYELGLAHALQKPTVLITNDIDDVPYDLKHLNVVTIPKDPKRLPEVRNRIADALRGIASSIGNRMASTALEPDSDIKASTVAEDDEIEKLLEQADRARQSGRMKEAKDVLQAVIQRQRSGQDLDGLAYTLNKLGALLQALGEYDSALANVQESIEILKRIGNPLGEAVAYVNLANVFQSQGDNTRSEEFYLRALKSSQKSGEKHIQTSILSNLGYLQHRQGRIEEANRAYREALLISEEIGDEAASAAACANLGALMESRGDVENAETFFRRSAEVFERLNDRSSLARIWHNLASVMIDRGDLEAANELLQRSLAVKEELGDQSGTASTFYNLAWVSLRKNEIERAFELLNKAAEIQTRIRDPYGLMRTFELLSRLFKDGGDHERAIELFSQVAEIADQVSAPDREDIRDRLAALKANFESKKADSSA